jgi:endonuclease III
MFDRSVKADRAWEAARWINDSLGDPAEVQSLWSALSNMENKRLEGFLRYGYGGYAFHRHYKTFARQLPQAARLLLEKYEGDPRKIWNNKRDIAEVRKHLEEIPGIGPALSRMAVLILARNYGLLGGKAALSQLDIKPDTHVMRVFKRCGFIDFTAKPGDAIVVAQKLHRKFPGALDAPAFNIGIHWCRPTRPKCGECR